jgi:hypothetical protein
MRCIPNCTRRGVNLRGNLDAILDNLGNIKHGQCHYGGYPDKCISEVQTCKMQLSGSEICFVTREKGVTWADPVKRKVGVLLKAESCLMLTVYQNQSRSCEGLSQALFYLCLRIVQD